MAQEVLSRRRGAGMLLGASSEQQPGGGSAVLAGVGEAPASSELIKKSFQTSVG